LSCGPRRPLGRCSHCGRPRFSRAKTCRTRSCPGYSHLWAGDTRRKLFANLDAYPGTDVVLGTVTAPGQDVLPWDREHCSVLGEHRCSGALGCRIDRERAAAWNKEAPAKWRDLHRAAYQRCQRAKLKPWLLVRPWEMQHRGALHVHPVLAYGTARERHAARTYMRHLAELAPHYGFGYVDRKLEVMSKRAAAAYLSAYFVTGKNEKLSLQHSVTTHHMPRSIVYVSTRLTMKSGITMRELRFRRYVWRVAPSWVQCGYYTIAREIALGHQAGCPPTHEEILTMLRVHHCAPV
jgi:hypothetical protein